MQNKDLFVYCILLLILSVNTAFASTNITDASIQTTGNLTLGEKITFSLGEIIDNIVDSWIRVDGNLNVTGNATVSGASLAVNNKQVCLEDGTNCQSSSDTVWNITGSDYLYNGSDVLSFNETHLNATIESLDSDTTYDFECSAGQFVRNLTSAGGYVCDTPVGGSGYVQLYSSGNFSGSLYTNGSDPSLSDSNSIFQVIGSDGTPRFQVQDGGPEQASFITRSFIVINQNSSILNLSQNNLCDQWGFSHIDCNTSITGADMGVQDDFEVQGLVFTDDGICSDSSPWGSYLTLGNLSDYATGGYNGTFTDSTNIFCDNVTDPFTQGQVDLGLWIQIVDGPYQGAQARMGTFINSSCVMLSDNPAWVSDLTNQIFKIKPRPVFTVSDGGFAGFYIGSDSQSKLKIMIDNGSDSSGVFIDDTAGSDQHKSLIINTDVKNQTGVLGLNHFLRSSTGGDNLELVGYYSELSTSGMENSDYSFMEFNQIGEKGTNDIRVFDIYGEYSELMRYENLATVDYIGYYNGASLTNITTEATSSSSDIEVFSNDDDEIYFCSSANLTGFSVTLETAASANLLLDYFYYADDGTWKALSVTDTTNGFTVSGSLRWATPSDINVTSEDRNSNPIGGAYYCVVIQRTRNNVVTAPVEDLFSTTGGVQFLLRDDLIKLTPASAPPVVCTDSYDGAIYYDSDSKFHCSCKAGTGWVQMNDYSTSCS